jgi:hypothetical protein
VHAYVPAAAGCWRLFGELQADEYARFGYPRTHGLVVDAYMAQHPGDGSDRRDRQSVFVHLVGLCGVLELGLPPQRRADLLRRIVSGRDDFPVLVRPPGRGTLTLLHVADAPDATAYERRAREWGATVWAAWEPHHELVRTAVGDALSR